MNNDQTIQSWQEAIVRECEERLQRSLTADEETFIKSRGGCIALEMIEDTVKTLSGNELAAYLNSETDSQS